MEPKISHASDKNRLQKIVNNYASHDYGTSTLQTDGQTTWLGNTALHYVSRGKKTDR